MSKIAIHGFGRIGRSALKAALDGRHFVPVSISDIKDVPTLARCLRLTRITAAGTRKSRSLRAFRHRRAGDQVLRHYPVAAGLGRAGGGPGGGLHRARDAAGRRPGTPRPRSQASVGQCSQQDFAGLRRRPPAGITSSSSTPAAPHH